MQAATHSLVGQQQHLHAASMRATVAPLLNMTVDPFAGSAASFLHSVPIPPVCFLLLASLCACLLNALLNYFLARDTDVPLLQTQVAALEPKAVEGIYSPVSGVGSMAGPAMVNAPGGPMSLDASGREDAGERGESATKYGTVGGASRGPSPMFQANVESTLGASRLYERHIAFAAAARRHMRSSHHHYATDTSGSGGGHQPGSFDDPRETFKETDALLSGDQLHFPASPMPMNDSFDRDWQWRSSPPTGGAIHVTPTSNFAQSLALPGGAPSALAVEAVVAAANYQSTLREIRLEAQYVVFDTNRSFLLASVVKCLCMLIFLHYHLQTPGGWKRFTIATGVGLMCGLLTPVMELLSASLLPNDAEVQDARTRRLLEEENDRNEPADSVLVVELVLAYCTYDFKDLTTVFIQGSVFILIGVVVIPPVLGFCLIAFCAYGWLFLGPLLVLFLVRREYYCETAHDPTGPAVEASSTRSVQMQGILELLKCVLMKWMLNFLTLWCVQATFLLAMGWKEGLSYVDNLDQLWRVELSGSFNDYWTASIRRGVFWELSAVSQLLL